MIYLDYNATTPVDEEVYHAMIPYLREDFGNPSSLHTVGAKARKALEESRELIASYLHCEPDEIVFTSGGTESNSLAITGVIRQARLSKPSLVPHVVTTPIEHKSVLDPIQYLEKMGDITATYLGVDSKGNLDLEKLKASLSPETVLISVMGVNNEIGNIYPTDSIGEIACNKNIIFHVDAVQAFGKVRIDFSKKKADLVSFSSHKIYGPKGVGALFVKNGVKIHPMFRGGAQEMEKRGGTENLPGIVGFAKAVEKAYGDLESETKRLEKLRHRLEQGLLEKIRGAQVQGDPTSRICNTLSMTFAGLTSEMSVIALDRAGFAVSSGSACASGAIEPSHVLLAMGVSRPEAKGAVRFSLGRPTTEDDIEKALEIIPKVIERLRS